MTFGRDYSSTLRAFHKIAPYVVERQQFREHCRESNA
jgi:hypothetical protein